jgi:hypothetical protein
MIVLATLILCLVPALALSSPKPKADSPPAAGKLVSMSEIQLPHYAPPAAYREDLVISGKQGGMTMKRFVDHEKIRTEMSSDGNEFVMLETGDPGGTMYMIMPEQKTAMKQSRAAMTKAGAKLPKKESGASAPPSDIKVEDLGEDKVDGVAVKKLRMVAEGGDVLGWFDKTTGAPVRMESVVQGEKSTVEWKNRKPGPQSEELFQVPKGYAVTDMDEMMKNMGGMGAMGGMGGVGGMAKGMAGGMVQGMGSNLGGSLGGMIGGSLGGPLGSIAGQFIGGKIGGMLGKKAANAIN